MNIIITGSTGFLGKTIFKALSQFNILFELPKIDGNKAIRLDKDIPIFTDSFELVVHCAGKAHLIPKNEIEKKNFFDINVIGTRNLLKGLELSTIPKQFVFISSVAVYGIDKGDNINENYPLLAEDPYGLSKIQAEQLINDWCFKNGVLCTILRLPLLVGINPPGNLGDMINAVKNGYYFNIGGGRAKKSMVLAKDVAEIILKVAKIGGIYNLTDGYHPSFKELSSHISIELSRKKPLNIPFWFATIIAKLGDLVGENAPFNTRKLTKMNSNLTFNDSKARVKFGWHPIPVLNSTIIQNKN